MSKIIRIKKENAEVILARIPGSKITSVPPYENPVWSDDEPSLLEAVGMVGLVLPEGMSGNQAHKVIQAIKQNNSNLRECTCGSGLPWTTCAAEDWSYCG